MKEKKCVTQYFRQVPPDHGYMVSEKPCGWVGYLWKFEHGFRPREFYIGIITDPYADFGRVITYKFGVFTGPDYNDYADFYWWRDGAGHPWGAAIPLRPQTIVQDLRGAARWLIWNSIDWRLHGKSSRWEQVPEIDTKTVAWIAGILEEWAARIEEDPMEIVNLWTLPGRIREVDEGVRWEGNV